MMLNQRRVHLACFALLGAIMGAVAGFWVGRAVSFKMAEADLSESAQQLSKNTDILGQELNKTFATVHAGVYAPCSNLDVAALQAQTFRSTQLKDIGRTHDGKLYCSAVLGNLKTPYIEGTPTLVLGNGMRVYADIPLMIASMAGGHGTVLESGDVNVVLSPGAFDHWDRPHIGYMIVAIDRKSNQTARIAGSNLGIPGSWVLSRGLQMLGGKIYRSSCSDQNLLCAVTTESMRDVWGSSATTQMVFLAMGAFAGLCFGFAMALLYLRTITLSYQLHRAIRKSSPSLQLVYQPILDSRTSRTEGAEALLRWTDQHGLPVSPDVFVLLAEEKGFVDELTAFVVRRATAEMGELLRRHPHFTLSVNIAASDMKGDRLIRLLEKHVVQAGIAPEQIALELTERSTADLSIARATIQRLRKAGYKVHIDDFGTGFSSLSYLDQLAVNAIKIDRSFTRMVGTDAVTAPLLPQMIAMAESLGLEVIVEGVETEEQKAYLSSTGKPLRLQGWGYSRPLTAEALASYLAQNDVLGEAHPAQQPVKHSPEVAVLLPRPHSL